MEKWHGHICYQHVMIIHVNHKSQEKLETRINNRAMFLLSNYHQIHFSPVDK